MSSFNFRRPDDMMIRFKALQLVYDFDALRRPYTHPAMIYVEHTDKGITERYWAESPENYMDKDLSYTQKAVRVKDLFVPIMRSLITVTPSSTAETLVEYCQAQLEPVDAPFLAALESEELAASEILPDLATLNRMHQDLVINGLSRSRVLERFIAANSERGQELVVSL